MTRHIPRPHTPARHIFSTDRDHSNITPFPTRLHLHRHVLCAILISSHPSKPENLLPSKQHTTSHQSKLSPQRMTRKDIPISTPSSHYPSPIFRDNLHMSLGSVLPLALAHIWTRLRCTQSNCKKPSLQARHDAIPLTHYELHDDRTPFARRHGLLMMPKSQLLVSASVIPADFFPVSSQDYDVVGLLNRRF